MSRHHRQQCHINAGINVTSTQASTSHAHKGLPALKASAHWRCTRAETLSCTPECPPSSCSPLPSILRCPTPVSEGETGRGEGGGIDGKYYAPTQPPTRARARTHTHTHTDTRTQKKQGKLRAGEEEGKEGEGPSPDCFAGTTHRL
jgi:hypothetical protein